MGSVYKRQLNEWKATLDVEANVVLDIGGAQSPIKGMTRSWNVRDYKIIDLEIPHVQEQAPDLIHDMNEPFVRQLNYPLAQYKNKADIIFCLGVFDYIINPNIAMETISKLLAPNGYAWIEWPFNYATHEPVQDEGCRYSEGCVLRLVKQSGLRVTDMIRKMEESGLLRQWYAAEGQRAAKSYPYHGVTGFITRVER